MLCCVHGLRSSDFIGSLLARLQLNHHTFLPSVGIWIDRRIRNVRALLPVLSACNAKSFVMLRHLFVGLSVLREAHHQRWRSERQRLLLIGVPRMPGLSIHVCIQCSNRCLVLHQVGTLSKNLRLGGRLRPGEVTLESVFSPPQAAATKANRGSMSKRALIRPQLMRAF